MEAIQVARRLAWLPGRLRWDRKVGQRDRGIIPVQIGKVEGIVLLK